MKMCERKKETDRQTDRQKREHEEKEADGVEGTTFVFISANVIQRRCLLGERRRRRRRRKERQTEREKNKILLLLLVTLIRL